MLLVELDGHLYVRCGEVGDDQWLTETVGEKVVAPFSLYLDRSVRAPAPGELISALEATGWTRWLSFLPVLVEAARTRVAQRAQAAVDRGAAPTSFASALNTTFTLGPTGRMRRVRGWSDQPAFSTRAVAVILPNAFAASGLSPDRTLRSRVVAPVISSSLARLMPSF